jgi:hypothetical protein
LQNSEDVRISEAAVWAARDAISPLLSVCGPLFCALRQLLKKYWALFLWKMSNSVPAATSRIMTRM